MHYLLTRPIVAGLSLVAVRLTGVVYDKVANAIKAKTGDNPEIPRLEVLEQRDFKRTRLTPEENAYLIEYIELNHTDRRKDWEGIAEHTNKVLGLGITAKSYRERYYRLTKNSRNK